MTFPEIKPFYLPKIDITQVEVAGRKRAQPSQRDETPMKRSFSLLDSPPHHRVPKPFSSPKKPPISHLTTHTCRILSFDDAKPTFCVGQVKKTTRALDRHRHPLVKICENHPHNDEARHPAVERCINKIFKNSADLPEISSELAFLIALLDGNCNIPGTTRSLYEYRRDEILTQIRHIRKQSDQCSTDSPSPPPAIECYILRMFARTLFSPHNRFNLHTVDMARRLFNSPIKAYLLPEQQLLIQAMLDDMNVQHDSYAELFSGVASGELEPHPSLLHLLHLDWLLPSHYPYTSKITVWALIQAMFAPCGQIYGPTCYAIASINTVRLSHPLLWLTRLIDLLHEGVLICQDIEIPLAALMPPCLKDPRITDLVISTEVFPLIPLAKRILESLHTTPSKTSQSEGSLRTHVSSEFREELDQLFSASIQNNLIQLLIVAAQTLDANYPPGHCLRDTIISETAGIVHKTFTKDPIKLASFKQILRSHLFVQEHILRKPIPTDPTGSTFCDRRELWLLPSEEEAPIPCPSMKVFQEHLPHIFGAAHTQFPYLNKKRFYELFYKNVIYPRQPSAARKIAQQHRLLATEAVGGSVDRIVQHLFDLSMRIEEITLPSSDALLMQVHHLICTDLDLSAATMVINSHATTLMPQILRSLTQLEMKKLIQLQQGATRYGCFQKFLPLSLLQWGAVLHGLDISGQLSTQDIFQSTPSDDSRRHPYVIAYHFLRLCQSRGLSNLSLFDCYLQICTTLDCAPVLPFADLNWFNHENLELPSPHHLSLAYDRRLSRHFFCIANGTLGVLDADTLASAPSILLIIPTSE